MAAVVVVLAAACSDDGGGTTAVSCAAPDAPATLLAQTLPLGSGGFPPSPGSHDQPVWQPGKFPLTLPPRLGVPTTSSG